jgi:hypothetical protein
MSIETPKKRPTKNARLLMIFDAYRDLVKRPCTTQEVAEWAMVSGLYPVPAFRCTNEEAATWEQRLASVKAAWEEFKCKP